MLNPAVRYLQLGLGSLGYDPGAADGWYGSNTDKAARALRAMGPAKSSEWALTMLHKGLSDLGYLSTPAATGFDGVTSAALGMVIDAEGAPLASRVTSPEILDPTKPELTAAAHDNMLVQGSANTPITHLMMHCGALPGDWHLGKTNAQMVEVIHEMHTLPTSQGGRGWSDTGYHEIICPDGERIPARPLSRYGAGALGYNRGVKHILMIERNTITRTALPDTYFYPETLAEMRAAIAEFGAQTQFKRLSGHREVAAKLCPGFDVIDRDWTDLAVA